MDIPSRLASTADPASMEMWGYIGFIAPVTGTLAVASVMSVLIPSKEESKPA